MTTNQKSNNEGILRSNTVQGNTEEIQSIIEGKINDLKLDEKFKEINDQMFQISYVVADISNSVQSIANKLTGKSKANEKKGKRKAKITSKRLKISKNSEENDQNLSSSESFRDSLVEENDDNQEEKK